MNTEKKSLVEEALLQMKNLENVVTENAKGILASTMKEEIEELVKESLEEGTEEEKMSDESYEMEEGTHMSMYEDEDEDSTTIDITATDDDTMMMGDDFGAESDDDDEIAPLDLTQGVSDEELMKIVMGMGEDDRLMIAKSGDDVDVDMMKQTDSMSFPMGGEELSDDDEINFSEPSLGDEVEEEIVYEIEMSEDDDENDENAEGVMESKNKTYVGMGMGKPKFSYEKSKGGFKDDKKVAPEAKKFTKGEFKESAEVEEMDDEDLISAPETSEASRTLGNGKRNYPKRDSLPKRKVEPNKALEEEVRVLRLKNEEYRKALNIFREKLNEVAVFNSNLAYATRLFTEHTTTKQEKINIMRRFDNVETIKESKNLYSQIKNELGTKETTVVKESIVENIDRTPTKGSTNLVENKTYENPQFLRMKDLMSKLTK